MGGGILGGEYKPDKPGWRTSSWVENIKLGGEMCGGHRLVMNMVGGVV